MARIFVNPAIKKALCREAGADRAWLVEGPADLRAQLPLPHPPRLPARRGGLRRPGAAAAGDGCGAELDGWFTDAMLHPKPGGKPRPPMTMAQLPAECRQVLVAQVGATEAPSRRDVGARLCGVALGDAAVRFAREAVGPGQEQARDDEDEVDADVPARSRSDMLPTFMNAFRSWIAEIATIDDMSFSLSPVKSILPIHSGQSLCLLASMRETKFS